MAAILPGVVFAGLGFCILFGLLASVGAMAKSKQFSAIGELASGRAGGGKRVLFFVAVVLMFFGACGTFAGVAANDGKRARACTATCAAKGYPRGVIGGSKETDPKRGVPAFVACTCTGNESEPLELRADSLESRPSR